MTCYKPALALSAISLLLAGCGGSDSSSEPGTTQIKLVVQSIENMQSQADTGDRVARQVDTKAYQHLLITDGYEIAVDEGDDGGESYVLRNQSFDYDSDNTITLSVTGKATVTVSHPYIHDADDTYTVTSVEKQQCTADDNKHCHSQYAVPITASHTPTSIYLANTQWNYVTVPDSPIYYDKGDLIAPPQLGYSDMNKSTTPTDGEHYWYGYASAETEMQVATTEGFYVVPIYMDEQRNRHQAVTQSTTVEGDIVFHAPPVEEMGPIAPILPEQRYTLSSPANNSEYDCRLANGVHYSFKAYNKNKKACLIPSLSPNAQTRQHWEYIVNAPFSPLPAETTTYYKEIDTQHNSKQICHNTITLGSHTEQYQKAIHSYQNPYSTQASCFAEVMDINLYLDSKAALFSLELLNQELDGLQFFDVQNKVKLDSLNNINCDNFTEHEVKNCQFIAYESSTFNRMFFDVSHNDITIPLKSFSGTETLSQLNYYGVISFDSPKNDTSGVFYQFAIISPDKIIKRHIMILPSVHINFHQAYVYDEQFKLLESYTEQNALIDFYRDYRGFTLVRNTDNPGYSLILRIQNIKGSEVEFRGLDFTFHDSLQ